MGIAGELYRQTQNAHALRGKLYAEIYNFSTDSTKRAQLRKKLPETLAPPVVKCHNGGEAFVAQINWQDYTDTEIRDAIWEWVDSNRPKGVGFSTLKGKKKETRQRVMLDRLAIMRLLHHATVKEIAEKFPAAWKRYGERKAVTENQKDYGGVDWYRERKYAKLEFQRLFPFLKSELPLSWRTKAGRR